MTVKQKIIKRGVMNLQSCGYPGVNSKNILTDDIYSKFFLSMLQDNLGNGFDDVINEIIGEIKP